MKTRPNEAMRELRRIINRTQGEFAAMIGASKDAVASWETGRNKLSRPFARRISFATGAEERALLRGGGRLMSSLPLKGRQVFTAARFEEYRKSYWGRSEEEAARQHLRNCVDALGLLFVAAARPHGKARHRLPGVVDSFRQWCERTRQEFHLDAEIQEQLKQRKAKLAINKTYGQWRKMQREDPAACRFMGFRDDPSRGDHENLRLETETVPLWRPGHPMRGAPASSRAGRQGG